MMFPKIIWQDFRGTRIAASRRLPMSWREPWNMATAWEITELFRRAMCSG